MVAAVPWVLDARKLRDLAPLAANSKIMRLILVTKRIHDMTQIERLLRLPVNDKASNRKVDHPGWRLFYGGFGMLSLFLGVLFYASMRPPQFWISWAPRLPNMTLPATLVASIPCFIHVVAFASMTAAATLRPRRSIVIWTFIALVWEASQGLFPVLGTCDPLDFVACLIGAAFCWPITLLSPHANMKSDRWFKIPILLVGASALIATSQPTVSKYDKVYMSYSKLRSSFRVDPPRIIQKAGKILTSGDYLFISEPNLGIHVWNNRDPTNPRPVSFLHLPGNSDLAAKDDTLYADSFVDLVAIQFIDGSFVITHRELDVFSFGTFEFRVLEEKESPLVCDDVDKEKCFFAGYRMRMNEQ